MKEVIERRGAHCTGCGYDLRAIGTETECPECGREVDDETRTLAGRLQQGAEVPVRARRVERLVILILVIGAIAVVLIQESGVDPATGDSAGQAIVSGEVGVEVAGEGKNAVDEATDLITKRLILFIAGGIAAGMELVLAVASDDDFIVSIDDDDPPPNERWAPPKDGNPYSPYLNLTGWDSHA